MEKSKIICSVAHAVSFQEPTSFVVPSKGSKGYRLQTTDYILQTTDYRLQTTEHRLQNTDYSLQTTDYSP